MKLNCKRIDFTYTPGEEIFAFPKKSGLPFIFDVEEELTADPVAMDAVGEMLDEMCIRDSLYTHYYLRYFCFICVIKGDLYESVRLCHYRPQTNKILLWI